MIANLKKIYDLSGKDKYVSILLTDGRVIIGRADCFGETENEETGEVFTDLLVVMQDGSGEILTESDIVAVSTLN